MQWQLQQQWVNQNDYFINSTRQQLQLIQGSTVDSRENEPTYWIVVVNSIFSAIKKLSRPGRWPVAGGRVGSHQNIEEMNSINNFQYSSNAITSSIKLSNLFEKKKKTWLMLLL